MAAIDLYQLLARFETRWLNSDMCGGRCALSVCPSAASKFCPQTARRAAFLWIQSGEAGGLLDIPGGDIPDDILAGVKTPVLRMLVQFRDECLARPGVKLEAIADNVIHTLPFLYRFLTCTSSYTDRVLRRRR